MPSLHLGKTSLTDYTSMPLYVLAMPSLGSTNVFTERDFPLNCSPPPPHTHTHNDSFCVLLLIRGDLGDQATPRYSIKQRANAEVLDTVLSDYKISRHGCSGIGEVRFF